MKCPACKYKHEYDKEGRSGEFFVLSNQVVAERSDRGSYTRDKEIQSVFACPSCGLLFIPI